MKRKVTVSEALDHILGENGEENKEQYSDLDDVSEEGDDDVVLKLLLFLLKHSTPRVKTCCSSAPPNRQDRAAAANIIKMTSDHKVCCDKNKRHQDRF